MTTDARRQQTANARATRARKYREKKILEAIELITEEGYAVVPPDQVRPEGQ